MSEAADRHFSYPRYTQDEWDGLEDEIDRLRARIKELEENIRAAGDFVEEN